MGGVDLLQDTLFPMPAPFKQRGEYYYFNGKVIGYEKNRDGKTVYVSPRNRQRHYFRMYQGWGVGESLLRHLAKRGVASICVRLEGEAPLFADVKDFAAYGIRVEHSGFETQIVLPETYWKTGVLTHD